MPVNFFELDRDERLEALQAAAQRSGRPADLLEKDIWVVWVLDQSFTGTFGENLTFKGGTSLSKVYRAIQRFSEDVDLTYDIRALVPDAADAADGLPSSRSQADRWAELVRERLPVWIAGELVPALTRSLGDLRGVTATVEAEGDVAYVRYEPVADPSPYVKSAVRLEFGARSTGEPHRAYPVVCDVAEHLPDLNFPSARPQTLAAERTFWEKATAIHVYCHAGRFRGDAGFARHWYDLSQLGTVGIAESAISDREVARAVAMHKSFFFREKDSSGSVIDYNMAIHGHLRLVPRREALTSLEDDYGRMAEAGLFLDEPEPFLRIIDVCGDIEQRANSALRG